MPNFTSQFSSSIPAASPIASIGLGGSTPPCTPFLFGGSQIPQMTHNMGGMPAFNPGTNPPTSGWNSSTWRTSFGSSSVLQSYLLSADSDQCFWNDESTLILWFPTRRRSVSHSGQPQPASNPTGGNFYNP
jgi:hypothetical protein